ncbi:MAG: glycoside hydrolase family 27 protein [Candidatus Cryptobacteroides sp.]
MKFRFLLPLLIFPIVWFDAAAQKFDGLALTPPMGWSSWNCFGMHINEKDIIEIADAMVESGLRDVGYVYLNLDDNWQAKERDFNGFIHADAERFPSGIKALADYVHGKGLKLGLYSDAGCKTCGGLPGGRGHEYQDAITYARWEVDYLKYDWCNTKGVDPKTAYATMRDALYQAGRPIVFSMCEWGKSRPWTWAEDTGHLWRTTGDIGLHFDGIQYHGGGFNTTGVLPIIDLNTQGRAASGPGHWNDPDMLEVGNGFTVNQDRAHFSMWCMMAAPLILGNDIRKMSRETREIIMNKDAIAIDQDSLGVQCFLAYEQDDVQVWFKPLVNNEWAVCLLNRSTEPRKFLLHWNDYKLSDEVSGKEVNFNKGAFKIYNIWTHKEEGTTESLKKLTIPGHDVVMYKVTPLPKPKKNKN